MHTLIQIKLRSKANCDPNQTGFQIKLGSGPIKAFPVHLETPPIAFPVRPKAGKGAEAEAGAGKQRFKKTGNALAFRSIWALML
jgi:hypothetical protein